MSTGCLKRMCKLGFVSSIRNEEKVDVKVTDATTKKALNCFQSVETVVCIISFMHLFWDIPKAGWWWGFGWEIPNPSRLEKLILVTDGWSGFHSGIKAHTPFCSVKKVHRVLNFAWYANHFTSAAASAASTTELFIGSQVLTLWWCAIRCLVAPRN